MKALVSLLIALVISSFQTAPASDRSIRASGHCEATAGTLSAARQAFRHACDATPRDCDPQGRGWTCSSGVIGAHAPPELVNSSISTNSCTAEGNSLVRARVNFAMQCGVTVRDCDPVGKKWICSAERIGNASPVVTEEASSVVTAEDSPLVDGLSVVAQWNELALAGVRDTGARPTITTWQLFMMSAAMYDALALYSEQSTPYATSSGYRRPAHEHTEANQQAAVSQAAYQMLVRLFPNYEKANGYFRHYLLSLGYRPVANSDDSPAGIGYKVAMAMLNSRSHDGSNYQNDFAPVTSAYYPHPYTPVNSPDPISEVGIFGSSFDPNKWQPLRVPNGTVLDDQEQAAVDNLNINSFGDQEFLTPHWGAVTPFALDYGSQFRPTPPPQFGSHAPYTDAKGLLSTNEEAYLRQIEEVIYYSSTLGDRKKVIAEFWADGPRTESPPGHWNQLAHGLIERDQLGLEASTHLFFALNGALLDAGIATWEAKRAYDYIRPASAIRWLMQGKTIHAWGGPNMGTQPIQGETWRPYQSITFVTPPFPEYVSGHSTFSRSSAEVLTLFSGSGLFYDGVTTTLQDVNNDGAKDFFGEHIAPAGSFFIEQGPAQPVVLRWNTFQDAADEAGISRLFGGIHIQDGDLRGRELGRKIGVNAYQHARRYIDGVID